MIQILHQLLGLIGIVPESWLLSLVFQFTYPFFASVIVKDTSSAHLRAAAIRLSGLMYNSALPCQLLWIVWMRVAASGLFKYKNRLHPKKNGYPAGATAYNER